MSTIGLDDILSQMSCCDSIVMFVLAKDFVSDLQCTTEKLNSLVLYNIIVLAFNFPL